jgi:hypothetical protein
MQVLLKIEVLQIEGCAMITPKIGFPQEEIRIAS